MRFGIHNPSWLYGSDPDQMFEELKRKAQWAEQHSDTWFMALLAGNVMPHFAS